MYVLSKNKKNNIIREKLLEIITCPPLRYQAYRPGSSIFARGPLGPRANMECRADGGHVLNFLSHVFIFILHFYGF